MKVFIFWILSRGNDPVLCLNLPSTTYNSSSQEEGIVSLCDITPIFTLGVGVDAMGIEMESLYLEYCSLGMVSRLCVLI